MRMSRAVRGSVTIFLCLILLPMITYSTMIIDASRMQSVRTNIAGAGDLTLNAALSEYNRLLEEMYGLFANCHSADEMKPALQSYFQQTVESTLIGRNMSKQQTEQFADKTVDLIMGLEDIPESERSDFLATNLVSFACEPVAASSIANPNILKRQIVDYMKYRGPISIATGLVDKLNYMKNASAQTDAVDKKREFSDHYADFAEACRALMQKIDGEYNMSAYAFNQLLRKENGKYVMQELLDTAKQDMQNATAFYLLNASSPYFDKPLKYSDLENRVQSKYQDRLQQIRNMPTDSIDDTIARLDALLALRNEIATPDGTKGEFETKIESYECEFEYDENHPDDVRYGKATLEPSVPAGDLYPTADNIRKDKNGKWYDPMKNRPAASGSFANEIAYAKGIFDAQTALKGNDTQSRETAIAEYITLRKDLADIAEQIGDEVMNMSMEIKAILKEDPNFDQAFIENQDIVMEFAKSELGYDYNRYYIEKEYTDKMTEAADVYIDPLKDYLPEVTNNNDAYIGYADSYVMEGSAYIVMVVNTLESAKQAAQDALNIINQPETGVLAQYDAVETAKKEWQKSIKKVDSSSTRSAMQNDYDSAVKNVDRKDIENLKKLLEKEIIPQIGPMISEAKSVSYLGQSIYGTTSASQALATFSENRIQNGFLKKLVLNDVSAKIVDKVSASFGYTGQFPIPPQYSHDSTITGTAVTSGDAEAKAKELADANFKTDGFKYQEYKRLRILDGLKEDAGKTIYEGELADANARKNFLLSGVMDPDEAFIVALYNIVGDGSEDQSSEIEDTQDKQDLDNVKNKGNEMADQSNKRDTEEKDDGGGGEDKDPPASEDFGSIMTSVKGAIGSDTAAEMSDGYHMDKVELKDKEKPNTGNSLSTATGLLANIGNIANSIAEYAYLEEYFTEMFTCATDTLDDAKVVMLNGYGNEKSGAARKLNTNTEWYGKEIEYILWGNPDLKKNQLSTDGMLFLIRFALNAIYAFTAPDITSFATTVATPLAWIPGAYPIIYCAVILLIAMAESGIDVMLLHLGEDVAIYKSERTFICSPTGCLSKIGELAMQQGKKQLSNFAQDAIEKGKQKVEENLDKRLDDLGDYAKDTVAEHADQLNRTVDEFMAEQEESVRTAIKNQFVTPILNQVSTVKWMIDAADRYGTASVEEMVDSAVKEAFDTIYANAEKMNDGVVRKCMMFLLSDSNRTAMQNAVAAKVKSYFEPGAKLDLEDALIGNNGIITQYIGRCTSIITDEISKLTGEFKDKVNNAVDTTVADAKGYMHERMNEVSEQISGKVTEGIDSMFPESVQTDGIDTSSASGGITLNYKEYCKIFILIGMAAGSETNYLQRTAVLIQANMNHPIMPDAYKQPTEKFVAANANTLFAVKAELQMKTIFPWTVSDTVNTAGGDSGLQLDFSHLGKSYITVNYCGVNGY